MSKKYFIILFSILILTACSSNDVNNDVSSLSNNYVSQANTKPDYFSNLVISNVSVSKDISGWYKIKGEIKNNNSVKLMGYINVVLYAKDGSILDAVLIEMPNTGGLAAGSSGTFSKAVSQTEFASYKFEDSELMEN